MSFANVRPATDLLLELLEQGIVDPTLAAKTALMWMSDADVKRMAEVNEFFPHSMEEEED